MATRDRGTIVVTGAAVGIGSATALLAARQGFDVCLTYKTRREEAMALVRQIEDEGRKSIAVHADMSSAVDIDTVFDTVDRHFGHLAACVNNAAINGGRRDFLDLDESVLRTMLEVNVVGYFLCAQRAMRRMSTRHGGKGGAIVNVSSQAGQFGGIRLTHYAASKAAVNAFTIGLAREAASHGIRVNAVSPGIVETPGMVESNWQGEATAEKRAATVAGIPIGRLGDPEEVARAIMWLVSADASYVTGVILPVAGGR